MSGSGTVVVSLGNRYRRDDWVGAAAAAALDDLALPHVRVVTGIADPMGLLEAWSGAGLAVMIDAAVAALSVPGLCVGAPCKTWKTRVTTLTR